MKPNLWNIKDILNVPVGSSGPKACSKAGVTGDYSSLTDSQFLFGSQFWPENSQGLSQDLGFPSRASQQNSQEATESKISTNYQTKPLLFGGDGKTPNYSSAKSISILDRFEGDKKRTKEKFESEIYKNGFLQLKNELLENMKLTLNHLEGSSDSVKTYLTEGLDGFTKTIQGNVVSVKEGMFSQFEAVINQCSIQSQTLKEIGEREAQTTSAIKDLSSRLCDLQKDLESMKEEQSREQSMLGEILSFLETLKSRNTQRVDLNPVRSTDNAVQTSPGLVERFCVVSEEKRYTEGMHLSGDALPQPGEKIPCSATRGSLEKPENSLCVLCLPPAEQQCTHNALEEMRKSNWQRPYCTRSTAISGGGPLPAAPAPSLHYPTESYAVRQITISSCIPPSASEGGFPGKPLNAFGDRGEVAKPKSTGTADVSKQKKPTKRARKSQALRRKKRALVLPQRRTENKTKCDEDTLELSHRSQGLKENRLRVPLATVNLCGQHTHRAVPDNHAALPHGGMATHVDKRGHPNAMCARSQNTGSSHHSVVFKEALWGQAVQQPGSDVIKTDRGLWQLFDIDSD